MFKENKGEVLHGILLIVLFSFSAFYIAEFEFVKQLSFSPLIVGIIFCMLYANSLRNKLPETWVSGIKFCSKQILRTGVVLSAETKTKDFTKAFKKSFKASYIS